MNIPKPAQGSLFAILLRAPFWVSLLLAVGLFALARRFLPDLLAAATTLPILVIAAMSGWRQVKTPSASSVSATIDTLRQMSWLRFSAVIAEAFRRDGYAVGHPEAGIVSYEMHKSGYKTLVSCKRWKVEQTGIGPLRELAEAAKARDARECIYVATGGFTGTALAFAREKGIRLLNGAELATMVGGIAREKK